MQQLLSPHGKARKVFDSSTKEVLTAHAATSHTASVQPSQATHSVCASSLVKPILFGVNSSAALTAAAIQPLRKQRPRPDIRQRATRLATAMHGQHAQLIQTVVQKNKGAGRHEHKSIKGSISFLFNFCIVHFQPSNWHAQPRHTSQQTHAPRAHQLLIPRRLGTSSSAVLTAAPMLRLCKKHQPCFDLYVSAAHDWRWSGTASTRRKSTAHSTDFSKQTESQQKASGSMLRFEMSCHSHRPSTSRQGSPRTPRTPPAPPCSAAQNSSAPAAAPARRCPCLQAGPCRSNSPPPSQTAAAPPQQARLARLEPTAPATAGAARSAAAKRRSGENAQVGPV